MNRLRRLKDLLLQLCSLKQNLSTTALADFIIVS